MKRSSSRILTTHAGSLPRPDDLLVMMRRRAARRRDAAPDAARLRSAVAEIVRKQVDARHRHRRRRRIRQAELHHLCARRLGGLTPTAAATAPITGATSREAHRISRILPAGLRRRSRAPASLWLHRPDHLQGPRSARRPTSTISRRRSPARRPSKPSCRRSRPPISRTGTRTNITRRGGISERHRRRDARGI